MSFSKESKLDILNSSTIEGDCCVLSFLSGLFHGCGEITRSSGKLIASFVTDVKELYEFVANLVKRLYGEEAKLKIENERVEII